MITALILFLVWVAVLPPVTDGVKMAMVLTLLWIVFRTSERK